CPSALPWSSRQLIRGAALGRECATPTRDFKIVRSGHRARAQSAPPGKVLDIAAQPSGRLQNTRRTCQGFYEGAMERRGDPSTAYMLIYLSRKSGPRLCQARQDADVFMPDVR